MSTHTEISPGAQRLLQSAASRRPERLLTRETIADGALAAVFVVAAVALALFAQADRGFDPGLAICLVLAYALVADAEFPSGAGFSVPTQIVFVPMLLLLPTPIVPLLVALALILTSSVKAIKGNLHRQRILLSLSDTAYSLAPAIVLIAGGAQTPDWGDWPIYVAPLAAFIL